VARADDGPFQVACYWWNTRTVVGAQEVQDGVSAGNPSADAGAARTSLRAGLRRACAGWSDFSLPHGGSLDNATCSTKRRHETARLANGTPRRALPESNLLWARYLPCPTAIHT